MAIKLFDAHCHLQDPRIFSNVAQLIQTAMDSGVVHFAVNGVSEKDWHLVKQMGETYPSVIPCFGLHPWYVSQRSPNWFNTLREFFDTTPTAAVGEIGLDKGTRGMQIDFSEQVEVCRKQLELAKELHRPVSVHCVRAFGDLLQLMKSVGPFPGGVILHSYLGSAEMVPEFYNLGSYFSFSGFLMSMGEKKAKKMLQKVPPERILMETDAPDALPKSNIDSLIFIESDTSLPGEILGKKVDTSLTSDTAQSVVLHDTTNASKLPKDTLNHPANIHNVLDYVASLLEMTKEELAQLSYQNAVGLFSYDGSKIVRESD